MVFYSEDDAKQYAKYLEKIYDIKEDKKEEYCYWSKIQGHPNPYGKEFYDFVNERKYIKFSQSPDIASEEMAEINYKRLYEPMKHDIKTLPCEKSTFRNLLELGLSLLLDSI